MKEAQSVYELFEEADTDKSGSIDKTEFCMFGSNIDVSSDEEALELFDRIDTDHNGTRTARAPLRDKIKECFVPVGRKSTGLWLSCCKYIYCCSATIFCCMYPSLLLYGSLCQSALLSSGTFVSWFPLERRCSWPGRRRLTIRCMKIKAKRRNICSAVAFGHPPPQAPGGGGTVFAVVAPETLWRP